MVGHTKYFEKNKIKLLDTVPETWYGVFEVRNKTNLNRKPKSKPIEFGGCTVGLLV